MPRRFIRSEGAETVKVELGDGDWVRVRIRQTAGDRAFIQKNATFMTFNAKGDIQATHFDMGQGNLAALERMIVSWGGPGFCEVHDHDSDADHPYDESNGCRPISIDRDTIEELDDDISQTMIKAINERQVVAKKGSANP